MLLDIKRIIFVCELEVLRMQKIAILCFIISIDYVNSLVKVDISAESFEPRRKFFRKFLPCMKTSASYVM